MHAPGGKSAQELAFGDITIEAPNISKAKRSADDELVDYKGPNVPKRPTAVARVEPKTRPTVPSSASTPTRPAEPDGLEMGGVDEAGISAVVAKHKPTLIPCIRQVAKPGLVARIPIEFGIDETGRVRKVWVDNPSFEGTGLTECLLRELQKWPFKAGQSGASVNLAFNIGRPG